MAGGILGALFGGSGSNQSSSSSNKSYDFLKGALGGAVTSGTNAFNDLAGQLAGGFDKFKENSGFDWQSLLGTRGITGNAAAKGLLNSGSTAQALTNYQSGLGAQTYGNYLDKLGGIAQGGLGAGQLIAGAGATSSSTGKSSSSGGILSTLFG